ncbi:hypothetical protein [Microbacterium sp. K41]|uniref:hypothetical protein n=1 Tax=Microbacterium sp. K41 TaxID=2305437 RepID=UPI00109D2234|nr:hypothetical protein [Microbacterium sp. K41]
MAEKLLDDRSTITTRVMKSLSRLRAHGHGDILSVRRADGVAPIVVALADDCVGDVNARVTEVGGCANVIFAERDGFMVWSWDVDGLESIDTIDVHHDSTMGMLRIWLAQNPETVASFNVLASAAHAEELAYQF